MRHNHPNFRRELKHLRKDIQRGKIDNQDVLEWFQSRGFFISGCGLGKINLILATNIPSRIWARIGRAAKKKGSFSLIERMLYANSSEKKDFHEPPFVTIKKEIKSRTQYWEEIQVVDSDGRVIWEQSNYLIGDKK